MFKSPKDYLHYHMLEELYPLMAADYAEWHGDIRGDLVNVFKYEYPDAKHQFANSWYALPIYQQKQLTQNPWHRTSEYVTKLPGLFQCVINFIEPNGGLPWHYDYGSWTRIEEAEGRKVNGYTVAIGIDMPSDRVGKLAIEFDNEDPMTYSNGEIVCFDGRNYRHQVWNKTDSWRVSAVVDLDAMEFN